MLPDTSSITISLIGCGVLSNSVIGCGLPLSRTSNRSCGRSSRAGRSVGDGDEHANDFTGGPESRLLRCGQAGCGKEHRGSGERSNRIHSDDPNLQAGTASMIAVSSASCASSGASSGSRSAKGDRELLARIGLRSRGRRRTHTMQDRTRSTGRIDSINTSRGGVPKEPVFEAMITQAGLDGDRQRDLRFHGGPDRAVVLFSLDVIRDLQREGHAIAPGTTGENLTISGLRLARRRSWHRDRRRRRAPRRHEVRHAVPQDRAVVRARRVHAHLAPRASGLEPSRRTRHPGRTRLRPRYGGTDRHCIARLIGRPATPSSQPPIPNPQSPIPVLRETPP